MSPRVSSLSVVRQFLDAISLGATHSVETWDLREDFWQPEGRSSTIATFTKSSCSISSPPTPNAPKGRREGEAAQ